MSETQASTVTSVDGIWITRIFDAPRELVYRAWIEPAQFAGWFGGSQTEVPLDSVEMDVRPGGKWKATMLTGPEGAIHWHGTFTEVSEPERLALTLSDRPGDEFEPVAVEFTDLGDGRTEMRFHQAGGHMDAAGYERAGAGWNAFFDAMAEDLAAR
jgi:uncharacterized protein YndB with AHSA1/START domain